MIAVRAALVLIPPALLLLGASITSEASSPGIDRAPAGNPLWAVPLRTLSATRERPIFSPSRRPPAPPAVVDAPPPAPPPSAKKSEPERPPLSLLGTVVGRDSIAVLIEDKDKNVLRLHAGQDYAGWVLRAVKRREAKFEKSSTTATLSLPAPGQEGPDAIAGAAQPGRQGGNPPTITQVAASPVALAERRRRD